MPEIPFTELSWDDLEQWVGEKILERGKSYRRRVQDLAVTEDKHLIATVIGTENYVTRVWLEDGEPDCECSCPYWDACKHAVAVILVYLDCIKSKTPVPLINSHDLDARLSVYGLTNEYDDEQDIDLDQARTALKGITKAQLVEWAAGVIVDDPSLFDTLPSVRQPADIAPEKIVARLRQQIRKTTGERGWQNYWDGDGYTPDYSPIKKQLEKLLKDGHTELVLELGEELFALGCAQIGESDDEGETAQELANCLTVVFEAMGESQKPASERMIWFWDKFLHDEFALLEGIEFSTDKITMTSADWNVVAEEFTQRLAKCSNPKNNNDEFSDKYHRQRVLHYASEALIRAGQNERAIKLMIDELPYCDNYVELVDYLLTNKFFEQAEHWACKGFNKTIDSSPGIAWKLVDQLLGMVRKRKDWLQVSALQVVIFLQMPSVNNYQLAQKASSKAGCWPRVQKGLLDFLETGISPLSAVDWPLPDTVITVPTSKRRQKSPNYNQLIEIALYEKRTEDALLWFQQAPNGSFHAETIAHAVKKTHPDISLEIWRSKVEEHIARVSPAAYREAVPYLKKMKTLLQTLKRGDEYRSYVARLRQQHKAKRRLMQELDALDNEGMKKRRILSD